MTSITAKVTGTSQIKFTVTSAGDVRIKYPKSVAGSEYPQYEGLGRFIANQLGSIKNTMRGKMRPGDNCITMYNDSKTYLVRVQLEEHLSANGQAINFSG